MSGRSAPQGSQRTLFAYRRRFYAITLSKGELREIVSALEVSAYYEDMGESELCKELKGVLNVEQGNQGQYLEKQDIS